MCGAALWKALFPHLPPSPSGLQGAPAAPPPPARPFCPTLLGDVCETFHCAPGPPPPPPDQHRADQAGGPAPGWGRGPRPRWEEGQPRGLLGAKPPAESVQHLWPAPQGESGHSPGVPLRRAASVPRAPTALLALSPAPRHPPPGASSMNQRTPVEGSLVTLFTDPRRWGQPGQRHGVSTLPPGRGAGRRRAGTRQGSPPRGPAAALLPASSDFALGRGPSLLAAVSGKQVGLEFRAVRHQTPAEPPLQPVTGPRS